MIKIDTNIGQNKCYDYASNNDEINNGKEVDQSSRASIKCTKDTFEKSMEVAKLDTGFYSNYTKDHVVSLPINCYNDFETKKPEIKEIQKKMREVFKNYYSENASLEDIKERFKESFEKLKEYNIRLNRTNGTITDDNRQMLLDTYEIFRREGVVLQARASCFDKGSELAKEYGGTKIVNGQYYDVDWVYYDANLNYMSEDARVAMKEAVEELSKEYNLGDIDTSPRDNDEALDKINSSFNESWAWDSSNNVNICSMNNPKITPPKGFTFFYKSRKYSAEDLNSGTQYLVTSSDGLNTYSRSILVPKGKSLWKNNIYRDKYLSNFISNTYTTQGSIVLDIASLVNSYSKGDR